MTRSLETVQDEYLVLAAQAGDAAAFERLVRQWLPVMRRHAARLVGDSAAAEDIAQEVCAALVGGIRRLDDPARARAWMFRIVTNKATDWVRRRQRDRKLAQSVAMREPRPVSRDSGEELDMAAKTILIREACQLLPAELRAVVSLYYGEGLSIAQIAAVVGAAIGTVKSRLHEARSQLKSILERNVHEQV